MSMMSHGMKKGIAAVAAVAALFGMAACGSSSGNADTGGKTVIKFLYATGDETWNGTVKDLAEAYNAQSDTAKVVPEPLPAGSDYATAMKTMDATGNWPAIVDMRDTATYIKAGKLAPIPDEVTSLLSDDAYAKSSDGNVYLVPASANNGELGINIIYDKDYFKKHNLEVPTTYDEFIQLMKDIKKNGDVPLATAGGEVWPSDQLWKPLASAVFAQHSAEGAGFWSDVKDGKASIADLKDPFEKLKYITDNFVLEGWQSTQDAQTTTLLVNHQAVMATSSAGLGRLKDINKVDANFDAGMFIIPDEQGNINVLKNAVGDSSMGLSISAQAKKDGKQYDAAVDFLKYYYSVEGCDKIEESGNIAPNIKDADQIKRNESIPGSKDYYDLMDNPNLKWYVNETPWTEFSTFSSFFRQSRVEMQTGQTSIDDLITKTQAEFDKDIKG